MQTFFFLKDWDKEVFNVFLSFKKAAVVSPIPVFRKQLSYTSNIWIDYFFSSKMKFKAVKNPEALERFAKSLGWHSLEKRFKDVILTLEEKNTTAVVSAAHCVATYKKSYLVSIPREHSDFKLGGNSEGKYLDTPPYELNGYRLSTYDNYAYHLGNTLEEWMDKALTLSGLEIKKELSLQSAPINVRKKHILKRFCEKLLLLSLKNRALYGFLLRRRGLTKDQLKNFWY